MKNYVLMSDLIDSKKIDRKNREEVQLKIIKSIETLNQSFSNKILSDVVMSAGDSIQGIFKDAQSAFLYFRLISLILYPLKLRGSISVGELWVSEKYHNSNQLDGPAYHQAKQQLDIISDSKRKLIRVVSENNSYNSLNLNLDLYYKYKDNFSDKTNVVNLINELIDPLVFDKSFSLDTKTILELVKTTILENFDGYKSKKLALEIGNKIFLLDNKTSTLIESDFVSRGIHEIIGEILGVSRQNIQRYFQDSIQYERMITAEISLLLKEV